MKGHLKDYYKEEDSMKTFGTLVGLIVLLLLALFFFNTNNRSENKIENTANISNVIIEKDNMENNKDHKLVTFNTSKGIFKVELFADKAPKTVENFVKLASEGFYDGTRFHRVISDFMIQGGDPLSKDVSKKALWGTGDPGYKFEDEINDVLLVEGVIAMANGGPNTNGSQFFIVTAEVTPWLDGAHTAFGNVVEGFEVVKAIEGVAKDAGDKPLEDVIVLSVVVE